MIVLLFAPEAVVHPSFQMSFAATLALLAGYERCAIKLRGSADSSLGARAALWGVNEIVGCRDHALPAFHFHRIAPYGVLANLLAMPIVWAWVMPMGILGVLAMPFGLDAEFWRQMGYGIEWMDAVGLWVAGLPGTFGRVTLHRPTVTRDRGPPRRRLTQNAAAVERIPAGGTGGLFGRLSRRCRMCLSRPTGGLSPCAVPTAD
jgi:predicted membrane metal-binding protein